MSPIQVSYPGVYIEEVPSGVKAISGVSTSIAVFIGLASHEKRYNDPPATYEPKPKRLFSYPEYQREFGPPHPDSDLATAVRLFFLNGGSECYVVNISDNATKATKEIPDILNEIMEFEAKFRGREGNQISVEIADSNSVDNTFSVVVRYDNVVKERFTNCNMNSTDENFVETKMADSNYVSCNVSNYTLPSNGTFQLDSASDTSLPTTYTETESLYEAALNSLDSVDIFNLLVITKLEDQTPGGMGDTEYRNILSLASNYCKERRAFLLIDPYEVWIDYETPINHPSFDISTIRSNVEEDYSAVYFPRLIVTEKDPVLKTSVTKKIGPAAVVAGIIAQVDSQHGVWKAPAGVTPTIKGVTGLDVPLNDKKNGILNLKAINCIRSFVNGTVCWGARTVKGYTDDDYKYVPVRRLALYIEESLYRETKWVVFEPNDEPTWALVRTSVGAFMRNLFNQGAFQGTSPKEAFFVKCDKDTTTEYHRRLGILNIIVGFAPLKPAEFVIIQIQQISELT